MHISEGYLPVAHCALWAAASAPFVIDGTRRLSAVSARLELRLQIAAAAGFLLLLTALKLPSVAGSSSHPAGVALAAILLGPRLVPALALVVLLLQALLLAHGGLTTLGANVFSLGIAGPFAAWGIWHAAQAVGAGRTLAGWAAALVSSVAVYGIASLQLALAFPDPHSGIPGALARFAFVFAWTQVPIAVAEGLLTVAALRLLDRPEPNPTLALRQEAS